MRFTQYLLDEADAIDTGAQGKSFERHFKTALGMIGLDFTDNKGRTFDIKSKGSGWKKLFNNKNINIKVHGTKWLLSSSEITNMLPWDTKEIPKDFDTDKAAAKIKRYFNKLDFNKVVFLKPKNQEVQGDIIKAVVAGDKRKLTTIFKGNNFYADQLTDYKVRVLANTERVTSVAADKAGKVFMRSEKPRKLGAGKGTVTVTFRTPNTKLDGTEKAVMT